MKISTTTNALAQSLGYSNIKMVTKHIRREYVDHKGKGIGEHYYQDKLVNEHVIPEQSELQKWLRDQGVHIMPPLYFGGKEQYAQTMFPNKSTKFYDTYEECLEVCLLNGLNELKDRQ